MVSAGQIPNSIYYVPERVWGLELSGVLRVGGETKARHVGMWTNTPQFKQRIL